MRRVFESGLCPMCGGHRAAGRVTYSADLGTGVVVIRHVPAEVCQQCGEAWIDDAVADVLERTTRDARARGAQVEVVSMP